MQINYRDNSESTLCYSNVTSNHSSIESNSIDRSVDDRACCIEDRALKVYYYLTALFPGLDRRIQLFIQIDSNARRRRRDGVEFLGQFTKCTFPHHVVCG